MGPRPELHGPNDPGGVDLYVGGVEHAVLHLLYSRFWHKVLFDLGYVSLERAVPSAVQPGLHPGIRLHRRPRRLRARGRGRSSATASSSIRASRVNREYGKMGKSLKNSVCAGRDLRRVRCRHPAVYEMSMGPLDTSRPWATKDVVGAQRFLQRVWRLVIDEETGEVRVTDAKRRRGHAACAQPGDFDGVHDGLRCAARQYGRCQADRADQPPHQGVPRAARRARSSSRWC